MIVTSFDDGIDLADRIPAGATVGLIGCAGCASACGTGDTKRLEAVAAALPPDRRILFSVSAEIPCDGRALRLFARSIDRFEEAEFLIVLACEAGARSAGDLAWRRPGGPATVVAPLRTTGFVWRRADGRDLPACLFCTECVVPDRATACPVAGCPVHRRDGPCQERADDRCIVDAASACAWLEHAPAAETAAPGPAGGEREPGFHPLRLPALVAPTPPDAAGCEALAAFLPALSGGTLFLEETGGLPILHIAHLFNGSRSRHGVALGIALHARDKNAVALSADLAAAAALGASAAFLVEFAEVRAGVAPALTTVELARLARRHLGPAAAIVVANRFDHPADRALLLAQRAAGATHAVATGPPPRAPLPAGMALLVRRDAACPADLTAGDLLHRLGPRRGA